MHCCDSQNCMSSTKSSVRLVGVCQKELSTSFDRRQIPVNVDDNLIMKLQVDDSCMKCDHCCIKQNQDYQKFITAYEKLNDEELNEALCVPISQIKEYILHSVPCAGCRTGIDNFIKSLSEYHHEGLEPLIMNENDLIIVKNCFSSNPDDLYTLFYIHGSKLISFIESIPKSKKNRRCNIHSLDKTKSINDWEFVWNVMSKECRDEMTLVEVDCLLNTIENYLRKHKFCSECKLKVLEAYDLLIDSNDHKCKEIHGFCPILYEGLRSCPNDKHIHVDSNKGFLKALIARAELEVQESRRERHAKTLDVAQEEVLTCIGVYLFERFDKLYRVMRSEEQTWQLLFYIGVDCLRLNFEKAVDRKQDFSTALDILCEELRVVDETKIQKKQQKRSKRKAARRQSKANQEEEEKNKKKNDLKQTQPKDICNNKQTELVTRRRTSSCCSCLCHYRDGRSNSLSITRTTLLPLKLVKSHSCPSALCFTTEPVPKQTDPVSNIPAIRLSSSLETLFSSVSTRECVCHDRTLEKQQISCDDCPTSSSTSCIRCFSTRTDLGYSSGQDEISSSGPCECLSTTCDGCFIESSQCCPLHEEDENSDESGASMSVCNSVVSSGVHSHNHCIHGTFTDCTKTIDLCDTSRKTKLKLELSNHYPYFNMDLKKVWDEDPSMDTNNQIYISNDDLRRFSMLNKNFNKKRAQLRVSFKLRFQTWKQRLQYKA